MNRIALYLLALLGVATGVAAVIAGGADDSPGLQGIGVLIAVGTIVVVVRSVRSDSSVRSDRSVRRARRPGE